MRERAEGNKTSRGRIKNTNKKANKKETYDGDVEVPVGGGEAGGDKARGHTKDARGKDSGSAKVGNEYHDCWGGDKDAGTAQTAHP